MMLKNTLLCLGVVTGVLQLARCEGQAPKPDGDPQVPAYLANRQPVDDKYPLPQDLAKAKQLREARTAECLKATKEVFIAKGNAKAPWAEAAKKAMDANAARIARQGRAIGIGMLGVEYQTFLDAVKAATDAGCDDPLVRYWDARFNRSSYPDPGWDAPITPEKRVELFRAVLKSISEAPYPASMRVQMAWTSCAQLDRTERKKPGITQDGEVAAALAMSWKVFEELAAANDLFSQETAIEFGGLIEVLTI